MKDDVELRLIDRPALGFTTADQPHPRGEIVARTPRLAPGGYFSRARYRPGDGTMAAPARAGDEGDEGDGGDDDDDWVTLGGVRYFRTGDIGELVGPGEVRVIDRCKSCFKARRGIARSGARGQGERGTGRDRSDAPSASVTGCWSCCALFAAGRCRADRTSSRGRCGRCAASVSRPAS